jgi:hypothetical protein
LIDGLHFSRVEGVTEDDETVVSEFFNLPVA